MPLRVYLRRNRIVIILSRLRVVSRSIFRRDKIFLFERKLADALSKIEAKVEVEVRIVQRDDFPKIAEEFKEFGIKEIDMADFAPPLTIVKERFERGHVCIVADIHGDFVNLQWAAFGEVCAGLLERKMRVSSDSAYLYGWYTVPKYRGLGILAKALEKAFGYLYERGIRKVYTCISHDNFPSLRAAHKMGFRKIGTITYTKIYKLRLYQCKGETKEDYNKLKSMFFL